MQSYMIKIKKSELKLRSFRVKVSISYFDRQRQEKIGRNFLSIFHALINSKKIEWEKEGWKKEVYK